MLRIIVGLACLALVVAIWVAMERHEPKTAQVEGQITYRIRHSAALVIYVHEFTLEDDTRCVVTLKGIDCDWEGGR